MRENIVHTALQASESGENDPKQTGSSTVESYHDPETLCIGHHEPLGNQVEVMLLA